MTQDSLSEVLELVGARTTLAGGFTAGGKWAIRFPPPKDIKLLAVARGSAQLQLDGAPRPHLLRRGDAVLLAAPRGFVVATDPRARPLDATKVFRGGPGELMHIGEGEDFLFFGGHVHFDGAHADLMRESLPAELVVHAGTRGAQRLRWLVERLVEEVHDAGPGSTFAAVQLTQLMFLEVFRAHMARADASVSGRLRIIADRKLGAALARMHADPARAWHVGQLAKIAGMSRTAFAVQFKQAAGVSPVAYLTEWRMRLAQRELRHGTTLAAIAASLGYASESAFSAAFKRVVGVAPAHYRARAAS